MRLALPLVLGLTALLAAADEEVSLKFNWRAGQEVRYQVRVEGQVIQDDKPLQSLWYQGLWIRRITAVDREGVASFQATTQNIERSEGFWIYDFGGYAPGFETGGRIKPNGQIIEVEHAREGAAEYWSLLIFPDQPVPTGGAWRFRPPAEQLVQQLGMKAQGEVIYRLSERVRYKSRTCLKISRESHYQVGYDPRNEFRNLKIETRGTIWFDELAGNLVDAEIQEIYRAQLVSGGKSQPGENEPSEDSDHTPPERGEKTHQISAKAKISFTLTR